MASPRGGARRATWQRSAILGALAAASCHLTAEEIHRRLRRGPRAIGLATVYRALDAFVREGLAEPVHVGDGRVRYGAAANHHDHVVCLACGAWQPLAECVVPEAMRRLPRGFRVTGHQLEVYGYCGRCAGRDGAVRGRRG